MSTQQIGFGFVSGTAPVAVGGADMDAITCIHVGACAANAEEGTEMIIQDSEGTVIATVALGIVPTVITYQSGEVLDIQDCLIIITNMTTPLYAKLNQNLVSGQLAVNIGYTL